VLSGYCVLVNCCDDERPEGKATDECVRWGTFGERESEGVDVWVAMAIGFIHQAGHQPDHFNLSNFSPSFSWVWVSVGGDGNCADFLSWPLARSDSLSLRSVLCVCVCLGVGGDGVR